MGSPGTDRRTNILTNLQTNLLTEKSGPPNPFKTRTRVTTLGQTNLHRTGGPVPRVVTSFILLFYFFNTFLILF